LTSSFNDPDTENYNKELSMMTSSKSAFEGISETEYQRRIRAWTMYDWANSAFATTILAGVLPIYYSDVAGATLPSPATATALWSLGLSISLFISGILSPILGTISDIQRNKKPFLSVFVGLGVLATGFMVLINTGDWILASILFILGRFGFTAANVFYDALLPHVAREEDRDIVSTRGYAMGYLGGGLLLAVNVAMIQFLGGVRGSQLSFFSVAIWWAIFSIPILRRVPEPATATATLSPGETVLSVSFNRLRDTFQDIQQYRELFKFLLAFLIYNDGIGTIIAVAVIYGTELGLGAVELTLALLLVQFIGIPFSLIFGRIPSPTEKRRSLFLAFVLFNIVFLPLVGNIGLKILPVDISGAQPPAYEATADSVGEGAYLAGDPAIVYEGTMEILDVSAREASGGAFFDFINRLFGDNVENIQYARLSEANTSIAVQFNGQQAEFEYSTGLDHGILAIELDGVLYLDDQLEPYTIDAYSPKPRYGELSATISAQTPGEHTLRVINTGEKNPQSTGTLMGISKIKILPPSRQSNLLYILGLIILVELVGLLFAWLLGRRMFASLAATLDTKRSILLALLTYSIIAIWGYFLNSTIEFWFLAWMVAIVQGGSQALSRSLYASMSPAAKSGEFFGLFGIMEKFSAILGPILFAAAAAAFGSSRPAIFSLIAFFIIGGWLLMSINVDEGRRVAKEEDAAILGIET
jgi:UMF1 family MFS transporter